MPSDSNLVIWLLILRKPDGELLSYQLSVTALVKSTTDCNDYRKGEWKLFTFMGSWWWQVDYAVDLVLDLLYHKSQAYSIITSAKPIHPVPTAKFSLGQWERTAFVRTGAIAVFLESYIRKLGISMVAMVNTSFRFKAYLMWRFKDASAPRRPEGSTWPGESGLTNCGRRFRNRPGVWLLMD